MRMLLRSALAMLLSCHSSAPSPTIPTPRTSRIVRDLPLNDAAVIDADAPDVVPLAQEELTERVEPEAPVPGSWQDPVALAGISQDCRYQPAPVGEGPESVGPLACADGLFGQSCSFDPCHDHVETPCHRVCAATCEGCYTRCRSACDRCRRPCTDDACRQGCGHTTANCLDACLGPVTRCVTAGCTRRYQDCSRRAGIAFQRTCRPVCARCNDRCENAGDPMACFDTCFAHAVGCTADQQNLCRMVGSTWGSEYLDAGVRDAP